ncbi:MAG: ribosome silencing factor [Elusimicrobiota bacterium]
MPGGPSPQQQGKLYKRLAAAAARAADEKKGDDIALLHTRPVSALADYTLIVSVTSANHLEAVEESVRKTLKDEGMLAQHRDGRRSGIWRVLDYGGLLVHLMHPSARELYALDKVFHKAKKVRWNHKTGKARVGKPRKAAGRTQARKAGGKTRPRKKRA